MTSSGSFCYPDASRLGFFFPSVLMKALCYSFVVGPLFMARPFSSALCISLANSASNIRSVPVLLGKCYCFSSRFFFGKYLSWRGVVPDTQLTLREQFEFFLSMTHSRCSWPSSTYFKNSTIGSYPVLIRFILFRFK